MIFFSQAIQKDYYGVFHDILVIFCRPDDSKSSYGELG